MTKELAVEMEQLYTSIMQIYRTFETLKRPVNTWDDIFVFITVQWLDSESVKAWEHHLGPSKEPTWNQFNEFLMSRLLSLQAFEKSRTGKLSSSIPTSAKFHFQGKVKDIHSNKPSTCFLCSSNYYIANCPQYNSKSVQQRIAIINKHKLCYNCLGLHRASSCRIIKRCQKCGHKHHTTIHQKNNPKTDNSSSAPSKSEKTSSIEPKSTETHVLHSSIEQRPSCSYALLATAQILVIVHNGEITKARALIDQGSEISLVSERLVQLLHLTRSHSSISLIGVGGKKGNKIKDLTHFTIRSHFDTNSEISISAHILSKLTSSVPRRSTFKGTIGHI